MSFAQLAPGQELSAGAELWICGPLEKSPWTQRLDWQLNLQILRTRPWPSRPLPQPLQDILAGEGLTVSDVWPSRTPPPPALLLAAESRLPTKNVVTIEADNSEAFLQNALKLWRDLNYPKLRLFMPNFVSPKQAERLFDAAKPDASIEVVSA